MLQATHQGFADVGWAAHSVCTRVRRPLATATFGPLLARSTASQAPGGADSTSSWTQDR